MLIARVVIVTSENFNGTCDVGPSGGDSIYQASDHGVVYGQIASIFFWLPHMMLHRYWRSHWPGLIHSELRQERRNVAVLIDVDRVMLKIAFDVHAKMKGDTHG
jgi:hypothetical protein